eukprot:m.228459 g.228459  ORF g.228459 m.228459 type:complete len:353 (-) comp15671_c0_seq3:424-1482(-)
MRMHCWLVVVAGLAGPGQSQLSGTLCADVTFVVNDVLRACPNASTLNVCEVVARLPNMNCRTWCGRQRVGTEPLVCANGWSDIPQRTCTRSTSGAHGCGDGSNQSILNQVTAICRCVAPLGWVAPTAQPTRTPSTSPPTVGPTEVPTAVPSPRPSAIPTPLPTTMPLATPTPTPTATPTTRPTAGPTSAPTTIPTALPTGNPASSNIPTAAPVSEIGGTSGGASQLGLFAGVGVAVGVAVVLGAVVLLRRKKTPGASSEKISSATLAMVANPLHVGQARSEYEEPSPIPLGTRVGHVEVDSQRYVVLAEDPAVPYSVVAPIDGQGPPQRTPYAHPDSARAPFGGSSGYESSS